MLAVDTNVLVRYVIRDDSGQSAQVQRFVDHHEIFVCTTVLLEAEWVLRRVYGCQPVQVIRAFRNFAGLPNVTLEDSDVAARAFQWTEGGMDFADALHLAKSAECDALISFDAHLARMARKLGTMEVRKP